MTHEQILSEIKRLRYLFDIKRVMRYNSTRDHSVHSESVAEHVYGVLILAKYFLPLEDPEQKMDWKKIFDIILFHDVVEIETGDTLFHKKNPDHSQREDVAIEKVKENVPESMQNAIRELFLDYKNKKSPEAQFAFAVDKLEPLLELFDEVNIKSYKRLKVTKEVSRKPKDVAVKDYPVMKKFLDVWMEYFASKDAFYKE